VLTEFAIIVLLATSTMLARTDVDSDPTRYKLHTMEDSNVFVGNRNTFAISAEPAMLNIG
jgi:hypothetical protein